MTYLSKQIKLSDKTN